MPPDTYLTVAEVAERLHLSPGTVRSLIDDGFLAAIRIPGRGLIRVAESDLARFEREAKA